MQPHHLVSTALILLLIAAAGGVVMAVIRLRGTPVPPSWIAMLHGLLAAAALTLLIYGALTLGIPALAQMSILPLLIAAAVGVWLNLSFHVRQRALPRTGVIAHALVAAAGVVLLLLAFIAKSQ